MDSTRPGVSPYEGTLWNRIVLSPTDIQTQKLLFFALFSSLVYLTWFQPSSSLACWRCSPPTLSAPGLANLFLLPSIQRLLWKPPLRPLLPQSVSRLLKPSLVLTWPRLRLLTLSRRRLQQPSVLPWPCSSRQVKNQVHQLLPLPLPVATGPNVECSTNSECNDLYGGDAPFWSAAGNCIGCRSDANCYGETP